MNAAPPQARPPSAHSYYRPELDILRFAAFGFVFFHHWLPGFRTWWVKSLAIPKAVADWIAAAVRAGGWGVDLFFALSACLITELLLRESEKAGRIRVGLFYARRAVRIWPLYFLMLTLSFWLLPQFIPGESLSSAHAGLFAIFGGNFACAALGYPESSAGPLWSVSMEEQFYLAWPLLLSWTGLRRLPLLCIGLVLVSAATRWFLLQRGTLHPGIWCNTLARLDPIAVGVAVALLHRRGRTLGTLPSRLGAGFLAISVLLAVGRWGTPEPRQAMLWSYPAAAAACGLLLLAVLGPREQPPKPLGRILRALIFLGRISFGLYVFHMLGLKTARLWTENMWLQGTIGLALTLLASLLSWYLIEGPFLKLKKRWTVVPSGASGG